MHDWLTVKPDYGHATIHCDGSCPENPGFMRIGYIISHDDLAENERPVSVGTSFGVGTNNQAEYLGLIFALRHALRLGVTHVRVFSDSMLIVHQVQGDWKCQDGRLKIYREEARGLADMFTSFSIEHVDREDNTEADFLSKHPTDSAEHPAGIEINLRGKRVRKFNRQQAAMIRWWWKTRRCRNEARLARIFHATPSHMGRIGRGEQYEDVTPNDLPHVYHDPHRDRVCEYCGCSTNAMLRACCTQGRNADLKEKTHGSPVSV